MFNAYTYLADLLPATSIDMYRFNNIVAQFRDGYLAEKQYRERIAKHRRPNDLRQEFVFQLDKELREICLRPEMRIETNRCAGYVPVKIKELWTEDKALRSCYQAIAVFCESNNLEFNVIAVHMAEYKALSRLFRNIQREIHKSHYPIIKTTNLHPQNLIQMYNYTGIVVGIEHYNDSKKIKDVKFALNDANAFLKSLTDLGCDGDRFSLLTDHLATKTTIKEQIKRRADLATKDDVLIFYFAGHGLLHDGKNVLTCVDTSLDNIGKTTVDLNFVLSTFQKCASKKVIVFLDCCHSGITFPDTERGTTTTFSTDQLQYDYRNAEHLVVFASCKNDEKSQGDIERSHGAWSYYLIEALKGNGGDIYDSGLLFSDKLQRFLMENTFQRVKRITLEKKNQTPVKFGTETIDKFIVADVSSILEKRKAKTEASLVNFESAVISNADWDHVRNLPGFRSTHKEPKEHSSYHESWIQKIAHDLLVEEIDNIADLLRKNLRYKRKDIEEPIFEDGVGQLTTIDFDYVVRVTQSHENPNRYILTKSVENFKNSDILGKSEFNAIFERSFDELELYRKEKINVTDVIDMIEEIDNEDIIKVEYDTSDTSKCTIILPDLDGHIFLTEHSLKLVTNNKKSPQQLILSFQGAYAELSQHGTQKLLD
ncbi:MAG TPA: caspase family protein [Candidatus Babeliaceae bacterium]|nr:caspase family protein [Candidatus Babeliaceae bacterium]